jgi:hypothetical protein
VKGTLSTLVWPMTPSGRSIGPGRSGGAPGGVSSDTPEQSSTVTAYSVLAASMSRKKLPGPALTIDESIPGVSGLTEVTDRPPCLLMSAMKMRACGLSLLRVVVTRKNSPLMTKTGDCLFPLPLVRLTTLAPEHSESGPGAF